MCSAVEEVKEHGIVLNPVWFSSDMLNVMDAVSPSHLSSPVSASAPRGKQVMYLVHICGWTLIIPIILMLTHFYFFSLKCVRMLLLSTRARENKGYDFIKLFVIDLVQYT